MTNAWRLIALWLGYGALILAAAAAILLGKADTVLVERARVQVAGAIAPILETLSRPVDAVSQAVSGARHWLLVAEENVQLRRERENLLQWQTIAQRLEAENEELRRLLNVVDDLKARFVTARVVADPGGAFARSVLLSAGIQDHVGSGQIVVTGEGLVGRVVEADSRVARVLLISDLNSRIPVLVGPSRSRAILAGDNSASPRLIHFEPGAEVLPGDRVVTSGITDAFPPGLPVGVVVSTEDTEVRITPFAEFRRLEFVRVIDHRTPDLVDDFIQSVPAVQPVPKNRMRAP
ncbi:MAG: rod shape-determining protein MreC [Hyphomicrobiales bacterium]|nr:rod shape-determining protein MreC [Hyphomicrobiales bacterium]